MIETKFTKQFHRTSKTGVLKKGDIFEEDMRFANWNAALNWVFGVNQNHKKVDYHVTYITDGTKHYRPDVRDITDSYKD